MNESHRLLPTINRLLVLIIVSINFYIIFLPLSPQVSYWFKQKHNSKINFLPYKTNIDAEQSTNTNRAPLPKENHLVIPSIMLDDVIYEGSSASILNKGVWLRPNTTAPPSMHNTVLAGHRFSYHGAGTFYHLNKLKIGESLIIYWEKKEYIYTIKDIKEVKANAVDIENTTSVPTLTLYTCTPLWNAVNRLVIVAEIERS